VIVVTLRRRPARDAPIERRLRSSLRDYWRDRARLTVGDTYAGMPLMKFPEDLRVYEQLIWEMRANVVVEIGTHSGGSALWFRDRLRTSASYGRAATPVCVVTIDMRIERARELLEAADPRFADEIVLIEGDVTDPELPARVEAHLPTGARCMVVEDSAHTYESTSGALRGFSRFVPEGGWMIVEDGCVDIDTMRLPDWPRGVLPAIEDWLGSPAGSAFRRRRDAERYGFTCHPGGFLQRVE
jgi:cephalosporin hydroxylase